MRVLSWSAVAVAAFLATACDTATEILDEREMHARAVPVASQTPVEMLQLPGESTREAKERKIAKILEMFPELASNQALMAALHGELGSTNLVAISEKYARAAPLIAEVRELNWREAREASNRPASAAELPEPAERQ